MMRMLDYLDDLKIFSITPLGEKVVRIQEECDGYLNVDLDKAQLSQLIEELTELRDQMK